MGGHDVEDRIAIGLAAGEDWAAAFHHQDVGRGRIIAPVMRRLRQIQWNGAGVTPQIVLALGFRAFRAIRHFREGEESHFGRAFRLLREEPVGIAQAVVPDRLGDRQCGDLHLGRINVPALCRLLAHLLEGLGELVEVLLDRCEAQGIHAAEQGFAIVNLAQMLAGAQQVQARHRVVLLFVEGRANQFEDQRHLVVVAEVARNHHQRAAVVLAPRQHLCIERPRLLDFAVFQVVPREPQLRAPAAGQGGGGTQGLQIAGFAITVALDGDPPHQTVVLIWIGLYRLPERFVSLRLFAALSKYLGEVGQQGAGFAHLAHALAQRGFGRIELAVLYQHDAQNRVAALRDRVDGQQSLGRRNEVRRKTIVQRRDDHGVELVRLVPLQCQVGPQHLLAPVAACDLHLAAVGVIDGDEFFPGRAGGLGGRRRLGRRGG